jgi:hypothetical protein
MTVKKSWSEVVVLIHIVSNSSVDGSGIEPLLVDI